MQLPLKTQQQHFDTLTGELAKLLRKRRIQIRISCIIAGVRAIAAVIQYAVLTYGNHKSMAREPYPTDLKAGVAEKNIQAVTGAIRTPDSTH